MRRMTDDERVAFLTGRARTAKVATVRVDGRPRVAPIWYDLDGDGSVVFTTGAETIKGRSLRRDPRVSLCVDDGEPPLSFVVIDGTATVSEDLGPLLEWATRIGGRYMGEDRADEYGRRNAVPGELLVRVHPTAVVARVGIAD